MSEYGEKYTEEERQYTMDTVASSSVV
ncbi:hypothetical protein GWO72_00730 [Corynebacterium macginleyi]|nr:hypothetical protein [Corynebacterium macginleyi]